MSYPAVHDLRLDSPNHPYAPPTTGAHGLYANGQPYPTNGAHPNFSPPVSPRNQGQIGYGQNGHTQQLHKIHNDRSVTVSGQSEYLIEPDTFEIIILIRSAKPSIEEVKASVSKRKDYIISVAQQNKVLYRCNEDFITSHDRNYKIECQVTLTMTNYKKAQLQRNHLIEKLCDNSTVVTVQPLLFSHSQTLINEWRNKIPIDAISKAKYKAKEICESLKIKRGKIKSLVVGEVNEKYLSDIDPDLTEMASEIARRRKTKVMSSTATVTFYIE